MQQALISAYPGVWLRLVSREGLAPKVRVRLPGFAFDLDLELPKFVQGWMLKGFPEHMNRDGACFQFRDMDYLMTFFEGERTYDK